MKFILSLSNNPKLSFLDYYFVINRNYFGLSLYNKNLQDFLYDEEVHSIIINKFLNLNTSKLSEKAKVHYKKILSYLKQNDFVSILELFDFIEVDAENEKCCEEFVIANYPFLKDKKILLSQPVELNDSSYQKTKKIYQFFRNLLPKNEIIGNRKEGLDSYSFFTIEDYFKAYKIVDETITLIKDLNLSPLEQITFVYDLLKKRIYKHSNPDDEWYESRGLINVLVGDKIVCAGFYNLFKHILDSLGFSFIKELILSRDDEPTHIRAIVLIQDEKYDVNGNFFFDVTYDAKTSQEKNNYNEYTYFLGNLESEIFDNHKRGLNFFNIKFLDGRRFSLLKNLNEKFSLEEYEQAGGDYSHYDFLYHIGENDKFFKLEDNDKKETAEVFKKICESLSCTPSEENILKLFFNVRKIEYYLDPINVPFSYQDFKEIVKSFFLSEKKYDDYEKTLLEGLTKYQTELVLDDWAENIINMYLPDLNKLIEEVKLTRTLRNVLMNKKNL